MKAAARTQDFRALELKYTEASTVGHIVYFKEHSVREHTTDKPQGRTLLVVNVPPYASENGMKNAYAEAGTVQTVQFYLKPSTAELKTVRLFIPELEKTTFKAAYLVFKTVAELDKALKLKQLNPLNSEKQTVKLGIKKWIHDHNSTIVLPEELKESIESFMKQHDTEMEKQDKKEKDLQGGDDDGWVKVTRKSKDQSFARSEKVGNKIMFKEEKNKKRLELKNFYTFQIRESKMKHIVALRQKFEEDKKKIAQIKQNRRFKPF